MSEPTENNITFLRPSDFVLRISSHAESDVAFYCQSVNIPGLTVGPVSNARHARSSFALGGDSATFEQFNASFKVDENMQNYKIMYDWLLNQVNTNDNPARDLTLFIYNSTQNIAAKIIFINAIPISLTPLEFSLQQNPTEYLSASVIFVFDYYRIET